MKISKAFLKKLIQEEAQLVFNEQDRGKGDEDNPFPHPYNEEVSNLGEDEGFERASDTTQDKAKTAILDNTPLGTQDALDLIYDLIQLIEDPDASERSGHQLVVDFFPGEE